MPDPQPLLVYQGAELNAVFEVSDDSGPVDLTGYKAAMQVRPRAGDATLLLDLSSDDGTLVVQPGGVLGEVHVLAGADLTVTMTRGGRYDCLAWPVSDPTAVLVIASGDVKLEKRVTEKP